MSFVVVTVIYAVRKRLVSVSHLFERLICASPRRPFSAPPYKQKVSIALVEALSEKRRGVCFALELCGEVVRRIVVVPRLFPEMLGLAITLRRLGLLLRPVCVICQLSLLPLLVLV